MSSYKGKYYTICNFDSDYYGITGNEIERYKDTNKTIWVKLVFDFPNNRGKIEQVETWFKTSEITTEDDFYKLI